MPYWKQGEYHPINPEKYIGFKQPFFRSGMERDIFLKVDQNPRVVRWATELFSIRYNFNLDGRVHNYWIDLYIEIINNNNEVEKYIVEIKPDLQLSPPKQPKVKNYKAMKNYNYKMTDWHRNISKWRSAASFGRSNNMQFFILTENGIYVVVENGLKKISERNFF